MTRTPFAGPTLEEIEAAREVVARVADLTPMESSRYLADVLGAPVFLKCENLQRTGSYKIRGAYNRMAQLTAAERERGVVAASAGNHAQGVAYGADVVLCGNTVDEPLRAAAEFAASTGAVLIPPFDHKDVVAGQGTLGLEIYDQLPDLARWWATDRKGTPPGLRAR